MEGWEDHEALAGLLRLLFRGRPGARVRAELPALHRTFADLPPFRPVPVPTPPSVNLESALRAAFLEWFDQGAGPSSIGLDLPPREYVLLERRLGRRRDFLDDALDLPTDDWTDTVDRSETWARKRTSELARVIGAQLLATARGAPEQPPRSPVEAQPRPPGSQLVDRDAELGAIEAWLGDPAGLPGLLVRADPGTGKSKLLVRTLERIAERPGPDAPIIGAVLLRDDVDPDPIQLGPFLQQVAVTLAQLDQHLTGDPATALGAPLTSLDPRAAVDQVSALIARQRGRRILLVIDALDQVEDAGAESLLAAIDVLADTARGTSVRVLCTSRRGLPVGFRRAGWHVHEIDPRADHNLADLAKAVRLPLAALDEQDRERAAELVLRRSAGNWLWATVNARHLAWLGSQGPLPARIELQDGLEGLYRDGIARVVNRIGAEPFDREVKPLLGALAVSAENHLRWIELRWILGLERARMEELAALLSPFVTAVPDGSFHLLHPDYGRWILSGELTGLVEGELHRRAAIALASFGAASGWGPVAEVHAAAGAIAHWTEGFYRDPFHPDRVEHEAHVRTLISDARWTMRVDGLISRLRDLAEVAPALVINGLPLRIAARAGFLNPQHIGSIMAMLLPYDQFNQLLQSGFDLSMAGRLQEEVPEVILATERTIWAGFIAGYWKVGADGRAVWDEDALRRALPAFASLSPADQRTLAVSTAAASGAFDETATDDDRLDLLRTPDIAPEARREIARLAAPTAAAGSPSFIRELAVEMRELATVPGPLRGYALRSLAFARMREEPSAARNREVIADLEALRSMPDGPPPLSEHDLLSAHWLLAAIVQDPTLDAHLVRAIELATEQLDPDRDVADDDRFNARIVLANALRSRGRLEDLPALAAVQREILMTRLRSGDSSWSVSATLLAEPLLCVAMTLEPGHRRAEELDEAARMARAAMTNDPANRKAFLLLAETEAIRSPSWSTRWAELLGRPPDAVDPYDVADQGGHDHTAEPAWDAELIDHAAELNSVYDSDVEGVEPDAGAAEVHARALLAADLDPRTSNRCRLVLASALLEGGGEGSTAEARALLEPIWRSRRSRMRHLGFLDWWVDLLVSESDTWVEEAKAALDAAGASSAAGPAAPSAPERTEPPELERVRAALATDDPEQVAACLRECDEFRVWTREQKDLIITAFRIWIEVEPGRTSTRETQIRLLLERGREGGPSAPADLDEALTLARGWPPPGDDDPPSTLGTRLRLDALLARPDRDDQETDELITGLRYLLEREPERPVEHMLLLELELKRSEARREATGDPDAEAEPELGPAEVLDRLAEIGRMPVNDHERRRSLLFRRQTVLFSLPASPARLDVLIDLQRELVALLPDRADPKVALADNLLDRVHRGSRPTERASDSAEALDLAMSATMLASSPGAERTSALLTLSHAYVHAPPTTREATVEAIACQEAILSELEDPDKRRVHLVRLTQYNEALSRLPSTIEEMIAGAEGALEAAAAAQEGLDPTDPTWRKVGLVVRDVLWQIAQYGDFRTDLLVDVSSGLCEGADPDDGERALTVRWLVRALLLRSDLTDDPQERLGDLDRAIEALTGDLGDDGRPLMTQVLLGNAILKRALASGGDGTHALEEAMDAVASGLDAEEVEDFEARSNLSPLILNTMLRTGRWPT